MNKLISAAGALILSLASIVAGASGDAKATELLVQARRALGGEAALAGVQGLSCAGTVQRSTGGRQIDGELTIDYQLPDKMRRTDSLSPTGDGALVVTDQGVNGDALIRRTRTINAPAGMIIRTPPPPAAGSDAEAQALRNSRAEFARLVLLTTLGTVPSMPLEFESGGEAESPDGRADVLRVKGPSGFAAQLLLDKSSHRPLMLMYRGIAPQVRVQQRTQPGPPAEHGDAGSPIPEPVDITMYVDDYRKVDGVLLPHHVVRSVEGQVNEEWTFTAIKVNPSFKPDAFAAK